MGLTRRYSLVCLSRFKVEFCLVEICKNHLKSSTKINF